MALLVDKFDGFGDAAHDAFRPDKWRSNQYNLERRRVRETLELLGQLVAAPLRDTGLVVDTAVSAETPSLTNGHNVRDLHLHFMRPAADRKRLSAILDKGRGLALTVMDPAPWAKHLTLVVSIDLGGVDVGMVLPDGAWPDRDNAAAVLKDLEAASALAAAIGELGEGWRLGAQPLRVVRHWRRGDPALSGESFASEVAEALLDLAPVYRIVAWAEGNDRIDLDRRMGEQAEAVSALSAQAEEARQAKRQAHDRRAVEASKRAEEARSAKDAAEAAFRKLSGPPRKVDRGVAPSSDERSGRSDRSGRSKASAGGRRTDKPKGPPVRQWAAGDKVVLGKGLLAGKSGVVKSQSGFTVTVAVGALEVRVESRDLSSS